MLVQGRTRERVARIARVSGVQQLRPTKCPTVRRHASRKTIDFKQETDYRSPYRKRFARSKFLQYRQRVESGPSGPFLLRFVGLI